MPAHRGGRGKEAANMVVDLVLRRARLQLRERLSRYFRKKNTEGDEK